MSRVRTQSSFAFLISLTLVQPAHATFKNWIAGNGNWSVNSNWSPSGAPGAGDDASIAFSDGVARTINYDSTSLDAVNSVTLDLTGPGGNSTTLNIAAHQLTALDEKIGANGNGAITQSGGANVINFAGGALTLGAGGNAVGKYNLDGGTVFVFGDENVGLNGQGVFTQTNGSNSPSGTLILGANVASLGTYTLSGGTLTPTYEMIGSAATGNATQAGGTFTQNGGTNTTTSLVIGNNTGATGSYTLNAGSLQVNGFDLSVGSQGTGNLSQTGGSLTANSISIGLGPGGTGTYSLTGGIATITSVSVGSGSSGGTGIGIMTVDGLNTVLNVSNAIYVQGAGSKFNFQGGTITTPQINVGGDPSRFSWTGGTLDITIDATWDSGADPNSTSVIFGNNLSLSSGRTLKIEGNETIGGSGAFALSVNSNAVHSVAGDITLKAGGSFSESSGALVSYNNFIQSGGTLIGTFHNVSSYIYKSGTVTTSQFINDGPASFSGTASLGGTLTNNDQLSLTAGQSFSANSGITNNGTFNLNGATISSSGTFTNTVNGVLNAHGTIFTTLVNHGVLAVNGSLSLTGNTINNDGIIQGSGTITNQNAPLTNSTGGYISVSGFGPSGTSLTITSFQSNSAGGIIEVSYGNALSITSNWSNAGIVSLDGTQCRLSGAGTITNTGTIQGAGSINSPLNNSTNGVVRANGGEIDFTSSSISTGSLSQFQATNNGTLMFLQGLTTNNGTISLTNGTLDNNSHSLSNSGTINGYGTIRTGGFNNANGKLLSVGGGDMSVFGGFTNNGVVNIQTGRSAYFYGPVNGGGSFTGAGTAVFLSSLSPGNSPATVIMSGGATLVGGTALAMELGGTAPGTQYDQLHVGGELSIGGILAVSLINGFVPAVGSAFDLLDWGTLSGTFSSLSLPTLAGAQWDTSKLYTTGVLSVVTATLPGDYNNNGVVDAADYVVWRSGLGTTYVQNDYNVWRAHFGQTAGSGSSLSASGSANAAVPEPATLTLMLLCAIAAVTSSPRTRSKS